MEVIEHKGKRYLKASKAAREAGYTSDYVGQLCRGGLVDAVLIGRSWYVNADELKKHRVETKRNARVKAREQVKKAVVEYREKANQEVPLAQHKFVQTLRYAHDEGLLIPRVEKPHEIHEPMPFMIPDSLRYAAPVGPEVPEENEVIADSVEKEEETLAEEVFVERVDTEEEGVNRIQVHVLEELPSDQEESVEEEIITLDSSEEGVENLDIHVVEPKKASRRREVYVSDMDAVRNTGHLKTQKQRNVGSMILVFGAYACVSVLFVLVFSSLEADLTVENRATVFGTQRQMNTSYTLDIQETYRQVSGKQ